MYFNDLLKQAGLTKTELAFHLAVRKSTVSAWKDSPPQYVIWGLENYIDAMEYRKLQGFMRRMVK